MTTKSFEEALKDLEDVVQKLEDGETTLEESLKLLNKELVWLVIVPLNLMNQKRKLIYF